MSHDVTTDIEKYIHKFLSTESAGGILLMAAAVLAMIVANSPLNVYYDLLLDTPVEVRIGALEIAKPLLLWINDGLMAIFFFLVGLELKRELLEGELTEVKNIVLPGVAAVGGMMVPAIFYLFLNWDDPVARHGWAIPAATDIAFALGVLMLLGSRVPVALKVFLTSVAIFDDVGAIIIIALFYTSQISLTALIFVAVGTVVLFVMNKRGVEAKAAYMVIGLIMWISMLKSGVHATLTGVLVAAFIPMKSKIQMGYSPLKRLEADLHGVVAFFVLPVFAFANAGINLIGVDSSYLLHPVPLGVASGLFFGKIIGVFCFSYLVIKLFGVELPRGMTVSSLLGVAALTGIGFTMSLFIGSLAFEESQGASQMFDERVGIIIGSLCSGIVGYLILNRVLPKKLG